MKEIKDDKKLMNSGKTNIVNILSIMTFYEPIIFALAPLNLLS